MTVTDTDVPVTTRKDWTSDQEVRWCPGCGDYSILTAVQMLMPDLGVRRENTVFVSGIGCAARFPYYMNTYGMHCIHGRAPAIATGLAMARPDLDVWVVTGDGDALSIGGNHLIHALRRNVNLTILLFNNQIYGLTKGQYSPTSEVGQGHQVDAVRLARPPVQPDQRWPSAPRPPSWPAPTTWTASTCMEMFRRAHDHKGAAFVEIYQNCNVFNDGAFEAITGKDSARRHADPARARRADPLRRRRREGRRARRPGTAPRIVDVADVGEDAHPRARRGARAEPGLAFMLSRLAAGPTEPTPIGVFRAVEPPRLRRARPTASSPPPRSSGPGDLAGPAALRPTWEV